MDQSTDLENFSRATRGLRDLLQKTFDGASDELLAKTMDMFAANEPDAVLRWLSDNDTPPLLKYVVTTCTTLELLRQLHKRDPTRVPDPDDC